MRTLAFILLGFLSSSFIRSQLIADDASAPRLTTSSPPTALVPSPPLGSPGTPAQVQSSPVSAQVNAPSTQANQTTASNPDDAFGIQAMLSEPTENERSSSLSFEGSFVEGLNSNPFERLTSLGKKDDRDEGHLYHRKVHFDKEMRQTAREVGFVP